MKPKTRTKLFCSGIVVATITVCLVVIRLANLSLSAAGGSRLPCADGDYTWVSNSEIITFIAKQANIPNRYNPSTQEIVVNVTAEQANIASGSRSTVTDFKAQLSDNHPTDTARWRASPDGKLLLYGSYITGRYYEGETAPLTIRTLASGSEEAIDNQVYVGINFDIDDVDWMPDNSRLLIGEDDSRHTAALYNTDSEDDSSVAIPLSVQEPVTLGVTPDNHLIYTD
jgi:hypothetical protein